MDHLKFGPLYYHKHYCDRRTRVVDESTTEKAVNLIHAQTQYLGIKVQSILDIGCGTGRFKKPLLKKFKGAQYTGVDPSAHACLNYGWTMGDVVSFKSRKKYDLVLCVGVLQYLDDDADELKIATSNFKKLCRGALYIETITREDYINGNIDRSKGDLDTVIRSREDYEHYLASENGFINYGCGLWIPETAAVTSLEMEHA